MQSKAKQQSNTKQRAHSETEQALLRKGARTLRSGARALRGQQALLRNGTGTWGCHGRLVYYNKICRLDLKLFYGSEHAHSETDHAHSDPGYIGVFSTKQLTSKRSAKAMQTRAKQAKQCTQSKAQQCKATQTKAKQAMQNLN